ncbi:MAG: MFS transporter [Bdellovibrionales bacterium]|nr:MFS transporter [Bdellovibrionales bacterium]
MFAWFKTGPDKAPLQQTPGEMIPRFKRLQWGIIINLIIGYSFFYTTRLSLSIAKKPLIDEGILTKEQLGLMGSALFFAYAIGKFTNGFLADHANIRKFMSVGLLGSAMINISFGFIDSAFLFIALWAVNGWFQSMGSAPSCVSIFQWFSLKHRGTAYSVWAGSHNIGEGITFVISSLIVSYLGWRWGFLAPGLLSIVVVFFMFFFLKDRPQTLGYPDPSVLFGERAVSPKSKNTWSAQLEVLKSPVVWVIALSCAGMYVSRYAINSWAILYLQEVKKYSLEEAGFSMGVYPVAGLVGAILAGGISDRFFNSNRPIPTTFYGLCNVGGMALLFWGPGHRVSDAIALGIFGFGIGGLIVFLAGLMAADIMSKRAVGAVKGFIGLFAYIGASAQEYISSVLIQTETLENGKKIYDFSAAAWFWLGSGVLSMLLVFVVWAMIGNKEVED